MVDGGFPRDGGCRCGQVRFRAAAPPLLTMACHCRGCQRMTASAFSLSAAIPAAAFAVLEGEPVIGGLHGALRHFFCPHCMSWMFTRPPAAGFVNVRATLFDEAGDLAPFIETCVDERLAWAVTPAVHSYARFPPPQVFESLVEAYPAWARGR